MIPVQRKGSILFLLLAAALVFGLGVKYAEVLKSRQEPPKIVKKAALHEEKGLFIHVAGAVKAPGLYEMKSNARVADAVKQAVPLQSADLNRLNLAAPLEDGQKIMVPARNDEGEKSTLTSAVGMPQGTGGGTLQGATGESGGQQVNINNADVVALDTLPGIGPALAKRIVDYREKNGPFSRIEDLQKVSGIGSRKYEEIKDYVSLY